jgi:hypothetical protein
MSVVIKETYKLIAEVKHILSDDEYKAFMLMSESERFDFFKESDRTLSQEEIYPIGRSSKFKKIKLSELSEDEQIIVSRQ